MSSDAWWRIHERDSRLVETAKLEERQRILAILEEWQSDPDALFEDCLKKIVEG